MPSNADLVSYSKQASQPSVGFVVWVTGLSGAGKTSLARAIVERLRIKDRTVVLLDGDELREVFASTDKAKGGHDTEARRVLAHQYGRLCKVLAGQGVVVVIATISMFKEVHDWNRANLPRYFEIYLKVPLEELRRRDAKGIYKRFDSGELANVAGLDLTIDEPRSPDRVVEYAPGQRVEDVADSLISDICAVIE